jgi:uridylate kinase
MSQELRYQRILLKLSGEVLGIKGSAIDPSVLGGLVAEIKELGESGAEMALVIGGGNIVRGAQATDWNVQRVTADQVGMLGTVINGLVVRDLLEHLGMATSLLSAVQIGDMVAPFVLYYALLFLSF